MDIESALTVATARLWYVEMKKKQNESITAFVSEKDVFNFVYLVPTDRTCNLYLHFTQ